MAGDWIKLNHALVRSQKIRLLAGALRIKHAAALGYAVKWLVWLDEQTEDGRTQYLRADVDEELGLRGLCDALISIGWAELDEHGHVSAAEYLKHNGSTAKRRAAETRKKQRQRAASRACPENVPDVVPYSPGQNGGLEKRREENKEKSLLPESLKEKPRPVRATPGAGGGEAQTPQAFSSPAPTVDEIAGAMRGCRECMTATEDELRSMAELYINARTAVGWINWRGHPIVDIASDARGYASNYRINAAKEAARNCRNTNTQNNATEHTQLTAEDHERAWDEWDPNKYIAGRNKRKNS